MNTRVFLVRHGATTLSNEDRFAGSTDVPLGSGGRQHVERLSARLAAPPIAAVYCSPMRRTVETAEIVAQPHDVRPITIDGLREIDHGRWEGLRREDVQRDYSDEYAAWEHDPFTCPPAGGESGLHVLARALPAMDEIVRHHRGESVLVVSHTATNRLLIASWLGLDARGYRDRLEQLRACLYLLELTDSGGLSRASASESRGVRLLLLNDVSHYDYDIARQPGPRRPASIESPV